MNKILTPLFFMKSTTQEALWIEELSHQMIQLDPERPRFLRYLTTDSRNFTKPGALERFIRSVNLVEPELRETDNEAASKLASHISEERFRSYFGPSILLVGPAGKRELINKYYFNSVSNQLLNNFRSLQYSVHELRA